MIFVHKTIQFQVYKSTKHHLNTALCAHHPKQSLFPSPFTLPFAHLHLPLPLFPSGYHHTVVCVCTHAHTHKYTHIYIHTYTHIWVFFLIPLPSFIQPPKPLPSDRCQSVPWIHTSVSILFISLYERKSEITKVKIDISNNIKIKHFCIPKISTIK